MLAPGSFSLKYLYMVVQEVYFRHSANHVQHMVQRLVEVGFVIAHSSHCQGCLLPEIVVLDLGYRDIELVPDPVFQAAERMPLVFQRPAVGNMHFYGTNTDEHFVYG